MKKVLLATTILGMTAGFAAAEITWSGSAAAGFGQNGDKNGGFAAGALGGPAAAITGKTEDNKLNPYASFKLSVAATGESDSGLAFGASASFESGLAYTMGEKDGFANKGNAVMGAPSIFVSGDFGKITIKADGFKEYQADDKEKYDLEYTHTIAGLSVGVRTDLQSDDPATAGKSSVNLGYTISGVTLGVKYDERDAKWGASAAYTMNALTFTLATDNASKSSIKVAYSANGISGDLKLVNDNSWEANAGYTANGLTIGAGTNNKSIWKVTGSYDLGGGLTAEAGINAYDDMFVGAKMSF